MSRDGHQLFLLGPRVSLGYRWTKNNLSFALKKALTLPHSKAPNSPRSAASPQPSPENKAFLLMVPGRLPFQGPASAQGQTCSSVP